MRNRSSLELFISSHSPIDLWPRGRSERRQTDMIPKEHHCVPTCATPKLAAKQLNPPIPFPQHASTPLLRIKIFAKAHVPLVTPRSKNTGLIPSAVPRDIIRWCCGR